MNSLSFTSFVRLIVDILDEAGIDYLIGGSVAAWHWGEMRSTNDVDIVIQIRDDQVDQLSALLSQHDMLVPPDIMRENIAESRIDLAINAIHPFTGYKAEFFPLRPGNKLRDSAFARRVKASLSEDLQNVYVHSLEDLILYKLQYYSISRQTKHARDIAVMLRSGKSVDEEYLIRWITQLGLMEFWIELRDS